MGEPDYLLGSLIGAALLVLLLAIGSVRRVSRDRRLRVTRRGRVHAVKPPGTHLIIPLLDDALSVSVAPRQVDLWARAHGPDGEPVLVQARATLHVTDPDAFAADPDASLDAARTAVENALEACLTTHPLTDLPDETTLAHCTPRTPDIEATDLKITAVDLHHTP
ncbi:SPFH domain-containing protein [Actinocorallia sp. A-T 12471]|uniref:SPFH domain-containing protein n=1 Tax=Actinocorallia sp. A-T 12471 TaxID=3089813 RepID=UPI0029CF4826|nr:SPFH domain-containing protein [Actinocorallia sp. A-T 12471]MDX6743917.1 SPFH domain-containing protein [Actinocorallia sp. A-T 12471]